ncbi:unnamed protein product [Rhizoctonia solani]|uniref:DUF7729 domain-containing protein n=1 Tax=Rhizoctonia solani TaxID=456999 RepID=A0A8H3DCN9_9AGAM|nr:unnamed protein product [Rhizoctonia solani]
MKVSGIISALIFAHVAMGQAADSTSAVTTISAAASASSSAHGSQSGTKTGTKTGTKSASQSSSASGSAAPDATPTGSTGSTSSVGPLSESYTGDSNPLIPGDISDACSAFLTSLNSDTTVSGCLASLNTALSSFTSGPGSASAVSKTLPSLCSTNSCSTSSMRAKLTEFKDACSPDFGSNDMVAKQYDIWYSLIPFKSAICAKDADTQAYCLLNISSGSSSTSNTRRSDVTYAANHLERSVHKRAQTVLMPNTDTYRNSNLMYLFISPSLTSEQLCTSCTQQIISKYIAFESSTPYALGLTKSPLLGGQSQLWAAMQEKCATDFMSQVTNIAGVASADQLADGAVTTTASYFTALAAAFAAALALF